MGKWKKKIPQLKECKLFCNFCQIRNWHKALLIRKEYEASSPRLLTWSSFSLSTPLNKISHFGCAGFTHPGSGVRVRVGERGKALGGILKETHNKGVLWLAFCPGFCFWSQPCPMPGNPCDTRCSPLFGSGTQILPFFQEPAGVAQLQSRFQLSTNPFDALGAEVAV